MSQMYRKFLVFWPIYFLMGWRKCNHCSRLYPQKEMVKIRETGWYHKDHPIRFYARFFPG